MIFNITIPYARSRFGSSKYVDKYVKNHSYINKERLTVIKKDPQDNHNV